jgi:hypothetical protein
VRTAPVGGFKNSINGFLESNFSNEKSMSLPKTIQSVGFFKSTTLHSVLNNRPKLFDRIQARWVEREINTSVTSLIIRLSISSYVWMRALSIIR